MDEYNASKELERKNRASSFVFSYISSRIRLSLKNTSKIIQLLKRSASSCSLATSDQPQSSRSKLSQRSASSSKIDTLGKVIFILLHVLTIPFSCHALLIWAANPGDSLLLGTFHASDYYMRWRTWGGCLFLAHSFSEKSNPSIMKNWYSSLVLRSKAACTSWCKNSIFHYSLSCLPIHRQVNESCD